jgi:aspartate racemase
VPDRTKAVLSGSDAPFPYIRDAAQRLEMMGADILLLPCNTSHVFYARLIAAVGVPVINMVEETAKHVALNKQKRVGVLATSGTIYAGLYQSALKSFGIEAILPSQSGQQAVMSVIYDGVKAGADIFDITGIGQELSRMADGGAESFILGCTELPIAFEKYGIDYPTVDPAMILAHAAIVRAGYFVKS